MAKKKDQLGKGLRALLTKIDQPETKEEKKAVAKDSKSPPTNAVAEININHIEPNPYQPRKEFREEELLELVQSIKTLGLIQPITVRKVDDKSYQIISGERRWRASKLAGLRQIPAFIRTADDQGMLEMALVENIQRADLNALEVALSYQRLIDECELQHEQLAKRVGKDRSTVTNYTRLLKLPPDLQNGLKSKKMSMGHAKALLSLEDPTQQLAIYKKVILENLSVRNTEKLVRELRSPSKAKPSSAPPKANSGSTHPEVIKIKDRLSHRYGCKVDIIRDSKGKGKIVIPFSSDDQFNDIVESMEED